MKKQELPTRRNIERLLKELSYELGVPAHNLYKQLSEEEDTLRERLLNVPEMKNITRRREAAYSRYATQKDAMSQKLRKIRQRYLVHGLSPGVLKQIASFVEEVNKLR